MSGKGRPSKLKTEEEFVKWAQRATRGVKDAAFFLSLWSPSMATREEAACVLQLGYAVVLDKPIVIVAPHGTPVPKNVRRVARSVKFYARDDGPSLEAATRAALTEAGIVPRM